MRKIIKKLWCMKFIKSKVFYHTIKNVSITQGVYHINFSVNINSRIWCQIMLHNIILYWFFFLDNQNRRCCKNTSKFFANLISGIERWEGYNLLIFTSRTFAMKIALRFFPPPPGPERGTWRLNRSNINNGNGSGSARIPQDIFINC